MNLQQIERAEYPELDKLLWDTNIKVLSQQEALSIYEERWRFVDQTRLIPREKHLIHTLAEQVGGFLPAHV